MIQLHQLSRPNLSAKKKPAKNNVAAQPGQVQKRLNLDKNCKKLGRNKSHSASNLHKLSVKDYHESFQSHGRLSSASAGKVIGFLAYKINKVFFKFHVFLIH